MPNPKDSKWRSPTQKQRKRKQVMVTLSDEAREKLERVADEYGGKSAAVEAGIALLPETKE